MTFASPRATFRDPAGSLCFDDRQVIRTIDPSARAAVLDLLEANFCVAMQQRGDLIPAEVHDRGGELRLLHPKIAVPTYPWEWTPSQWVAAADLTLDLCEQALADEWILKDATPLNVLFSHSRPIFVDILSFERRETHSSIWLAYAQYVRTFLLPLLMNRMLAWPLSLTLFKRDGFEPSDCYAALSWGQRLTRDAFWPITLPALLDRSKDAGGAARKHANRVADPAVTSAVLTRTLKDLRRRTHRAMGKGTASEWSEYHGSLTHYTVEQSRKKLDWVRDALATTKPARVLDIGANTGEFSLLASEAGAEVVALERDIAAADQLFRRSRDRNLSIQTIHADLARPSPAAGWENSESMSLIARLEDKFELVMMLAVIHHLILMEQIPLAAILDLCRRLTRRHLIVEWVPVEDPMYQSLMRGRDSLYGSLSEADLIAACSESFYVKDRQALDNGRVLFLFERISQVADR